MEYIDLGLSVKWATCNVGASSSEEYGSYFAWGETIPKNIYLKETYLPDKNFNKVFRLPTKEEFKELLNKCTWTWTLQNGVKGYKVTGPNGKSIFLPAAGQQNGEGYIICNIMAAIGLPLRTLATGRTAFVSTPTKQS